MEKKESQTKAQSSSPQKDVREKSNYLLPFVVLTSLVAPSLVVIAYMKPTASFMALKLTGSYGFIMFVMAVILLAASVCALLYLIRGKGPLRRIVVAVVTILLWLCFGFVVS